MLLDHPQAQRAIAAAARENDADGLFLLILGKRGENTSIGLRCARGCADVVRRRTPPLIVKMALGGMTNTWSARTGSPSSACTTGIAVSRLRSSTSRLLCSGSRCWTRTKAMPLCGGMTAKNALKASSPPADAPRPTTRRVMSEVFPAPEGDSATRGLVDAAFRRVGRWPSVPPFRFCCRRVIWTDLSSPTFSGFRAGRQANFQTSSLPCIGP